MANEDYMLNNDFVICQSSNRGRHSKMKYEFIITIDMKNKAIILYAEKKNFLEKLKTVFVKFAINKNQDKLYLIPDDGRSRNAFKFGDVPNIYEEKLRNRSKSLYKVFEKSRVDFKKMSEIPHKIRYDDKADCWYVNLYEE